MTETDLLLFVVSGLLVYGSFFRGIKEFNQQQ